MKAKDNESNSSLDALHIAARVGKLMGTQGITQAELARRTGLKTSTITRYLQGVRRPSAPSMLKLAAALRVSVGHLMGQTKEHQTIDADIQHFLETQWHLLEPHERVMIRTVFQSLSATVDLRQQSS